jgi:hypothetical protein
MGLLVAPRDFSKALAFPHIVSRMTTPVRHLITFNSTICRVHMNTISSKLGIVEVMTLATTSNTVEKITKTTEQMSRSAQQATQIVNGYLVETQEINTEFARRATEMWIEAFRKQTELNQRMVQRLYGETEGQVGAFQGIAQDWMNLYTAPFFNPFGFSPFGFLREGVRTATRNVEQMTDLTRRATTTGVAAMNGGFPIPGYDEMNVAEVSERLNSLTAEELKKVRDYERRNKNRETLMENIDRKIKAFS